MSRNLDPPGSTLIQAGSPGAKDSKTALSGDEEGGDLATAQKVPGVDLADTGDGVATGNAVSAGGAESLISLYIPW